MTISEFFNVLAVAGWDDAVEWPPDVFGMVASLLQKTGAYTMLLSQWPPEGDLTPWVASVRQAGLEWRKASNRQELPLYISTRWEKLKENAHREFHSPSEDKSLCHLLLELMAAADEACVGIGFPTSNYDAFTTKLEQHLSSQLLAPDGAVRTLAKYLDKRIISVLPKIHTPKSGMTIRSFSHHLAICYVGEVVPHWTFVPNALTGKVDRRLNILLVPWPRSISPGDFSEYKGQQRNKMPQEYRLFDYTIHAGVDLKQFRSLLLEAMRLMGPIHVIIFPELSLQQEDCNTVWKIIKELNCDALLIAGIGSGPDAAAQNKAVGMFSTSSRHITVEQQKHHRWLLTANQIRQYGLSGALTPKCDYWERAEIGPRILKFLPINSRLTITFLICEDLARQDPIGDLIRGVGPSLLVALLMDGPQLNSRWPARYATVLADDPGTSVLTLTNLGMARVCRPLGMQESRVVALWKDAKNGPYEIELPPDAGGIILGLSLEDVTEWTADGRDDKNGPGNWLLETVFPVTCL